MKIYHYHPETKEYVGESDASLDPMATKRVGQNVFLIPVFATEEAPPVAEAGKAILFKEGWIKVDDKRGEAYYNKETQEQVMIETPEQELDSFLTSIPPPGKEYIWVDFEWVEDLTLVAAKIVEEEEVEINTLIYNKMKDIAVAELKKEGKLDDKGKVKK